MSFVCKALHAAGLLASISLVSAAPLTQLETNGLLSYSEYALSRKLTSSGLSKWGTLDAQVLPPFLTDRNTVSLPFKDTSTLQHFHR